MVAENLKRALKDADRSAYSVAIAVGRAPNWLYRVLNGKSGILLPTLREVAGELGVSPGSLVDSPSTNQLVIHPFEQPKAGASVAADFELVRRYGSDSVRLAAGAESVVDREPFPGEVMFRKDWLRVRHLEAANLALLDAIGDSMAPAIRDGDSVLVDESRIEPIHGRVFAMRTVDGPLVKRLRQRNGRWWADSDNQEHKPRPIFREDRLLGLVVWWAHTE